MNLTDFIKSKVGAIFIILPYIKPAPELTGSLNTIFNLWKFISALIVVVCFIKLRIKFQKSVAYMLLFPVVYFISTLINSAEIGVAFVQMLSNITICMYMMVLYSYNEFLAIRNFTYPTVFMAIVTALTMFVYYPNGMYQVDYGVRVEYSNYLWGFDNTSGILFLSAMFFLIINTMYINKKGKYMSTLFILLMFWGAFFYVGSVTTYIMMLFIIIVYICVIYLKLRMKILNPKIYVGAIVVSFSLVVVYYERFVTLWNYLKSIGKYYSVIMRFIYFDRQFEFIHKSPILGYGIEDKSLLASKIYIDHPHNYFMDLLYRGGIIAAFLAILFFYNMLKGKKNKDSIFIINSSCLLSILITTMLDFYVELYLFYPHLLLTYFLYNKRKYTLDKRKINSGITGT